MNKFLLISGDTIVLKEFTFDGEKPIDVPLKWCVLYQLPGQKVRALSKYCGFVFNENKSHLHTFYARRGDLQEYGPLRVHELNREIMFRQREAEQHTNGLKCKFFIFKNRLTYQVKRWSINEKMRAIILYTGERCLNLT